MAGLQYNFFPTDFFYPRPQSAALDATRKAVLPLQQQHPIKDLTNASEGPKTSAHKNLVKFHPLMLKEKQGGLKEHDQGQHLNFFAESAAFLVAVDFTRAHGDFLS